MCLILVPKSTRVNSQEVYRIDLLENQLAGRMPERKQFAEKIISPLFAMVLTSHKLFMRDVNAGSCCGKLISVGKLLRDLHGWRALCFFAQWEARGFNVTGSERFRQIKWLPGRQKPSALDIRCKTIKLEWQMIKVKDTLRSTVNLTFDGRVIKTYHGPDAEKRYNNEVLVLRHLERQGCPFVPRLLETDKKQLRIITNNCGSRVEHLDRERQEELFAELQKFGVRHDDPDQRNVTYRPSDGRFCLVDFEFATLLHPPAQSTPHPT